MPANVLVIEDDAVNRAVIRRLLEQAGHVVREAEDGPSGLKRLWGDRPDVVVLDITMPGIDGWEVLERIRDVSEVPVMMLTARGSELEKVRGLRSGADEYLTKPFGHQEFLARIENLLRRAAPAAREPAPTVYTDDAFLVDFEQQRVSCQGRELALTPREFDLMAVLVRNAGRVLSGARIIELVWGTPYIEDEQVKVLVGRLRRKLRPCVQDDPIETVRGFGYRYHPPRLAS